MEAFIPVNEPIFRGNEKKYLNNCIDTGWISSEGPFVQKFETEMARTVNRSFGIAVTNGSAALDLAVSALELPHGAEIIMPTFTIISCATAVLRAGLTPIVVDCDPVTWNMDASQIEQKITRKTVAIMVVHIYGLPVDMDPILEIANKHHLRIIEDAAEMHGQTYRNKPCGSFGDISIFSFYPNKHVTTGEGGMVLTDDEELAEKCKSLRNLCFTTEKRFVHYKLGYNFRMSNLQAAVGLAQLEQLYAFVNKKRKMGQLYTELLSPIAELQLPLAKTDYAENIYWVYGVVLAHGAKLNAKEAMLRLKEKGIGTRPFFWPMHEQPVFKQMQLFHNERYPVAENIARRGFYLPSGLAIKEEQIVCSAKSLKAILR